MSLKLVYDTQKIVYQSNEIQLLPKEFSLLSFLFDHSGQAFSREHLLEQVWGLENPVDRTVDDHIYRLRKKLKPLEDVLSINTIRGFGYSLQLKKQTKRFSPSSQDQSLLTNTNDLFHKYHLLGQGEAMKTFYENRDVLGLHIEPYYDSYIKFMNGEFHEIIQNVDNPAYSLYLYATLFSFSHFDSMKIYHLSKKILSAQKMPPHSQLEFEVINWINSLACAGYIEEAYSELKQSYYTIKKHKIEKGFLLPIMNLECQIHLLADNLDQANKSIQDIEKLLGDTPYLRELGGLLCLKGVSLELTGQKEKGITYIEEGLEIEKQSQFKFMEIFALRQTLFILRQKDHCIPQLETLWLAYEKKYKLKELTLLLEEKISKLL